MPSAKDVRTGFDLAEANAWSKELFKESDRGAVLIGSAYLEEMIERLLKAKMIERQRVLNNLFGPHGPLSTFASCTDLAYALGWIGPQMHGDLSTIRRIRNDFAHSARGLGFGDAGIQDKCKNLKVLKFETRFNLKDAKNRFVLAIFFLALQITKLLQEANRPTSSDDPIVKPVTEWLPGAGRERLGAEV